MCLMKSIQVYCPGFFEVERYFYRYGFRDTTFSLGENHC